MSSLIALFLLALGPTILGSAVLWSLLKWQDRDESRRRRRNPINRNLLRGPGHSLREELDLLRLDAMAQAAMIVAIGPTVATVVYAYSAATGRFHWGIGAFGLLAIGAVVTACSLKLKRLWREALKLKLGLDAEESMGQELNQLMPLGFRVFHDIPCLNFNVDHVVVGTTGLFVVETKGRSKLAEESTVVFDGQRLQFPGWQEKSPVTQVQSSARWLEEWLSSAIGEGVKATAVLALPGWYIRRETGSDNSVLTANGKNMTGLFQKMGRESLRADVVQRIAHQLDQRCRTVEPRAYRRNA